MLVQGSDIPNIAQVNAYNLAFRALSVCGCNVLDALADLKLSMLLVEKSMFKKQRCPGGKKKLLMMVIWILGKVIQENKHQSFFDFSCLISLHIPRKGYQTSKRYLRQRACCMVRIVLCRFFISF